MLKQLLILDYILIILASLSFSGCTSGLIYTDVTLPYTKNMDNSLIGTKKAYSSREVISEPFTGSGLRGEWANYAIGKTTKNSDIKHIHYADIRKRSILFGIWQKTTVIVYGD